MTLSGKNDISPSAEEMPGTVDLHSRERVFLRRIQELEQELMLRRQVQEELERRVTARVAEVSEQRDFAEMVMDTLAQGLTVTDAAGRFTYVNPAFAGMLGYAPDQLLGRTPFDFTVADDHAHLDRAGEARQQGQVSTYETRLVHADGTLVYALISGAPRLVDGEFRGYIATITDLTARRAMERALQLSVE